MKTLIQLDEVRAKRSDGLDFDVPRPVMSAHASASLVVHLAWATLGHAPVLASVDGSLAAALRATARELACHVVAVGHTEDEVHVIVRHPPTVCVSELAHLLKGSTSASAARGRRAARIDWQPGYLAKTCDVASVVALADWVRALGPSVAPAMDAVG